VAKAVGLQKASFKSFCTSPGHMKTRAKTKHQRLKEVFLHNDETKRGGKLMTKKKSDPSGATSNKFTCGVAKSKT
jgi:hypothetical protein